MRPGAGGTPSAGPFTGDGVTITSTSGSVTVGISGDVVGGDGTGGTGWGIDVATKEADGAVVVAVIMLLADGGIVAIPSELGGILS